jgi:hypothetical protein
MAGKEQKWLLTHDSHELKKGEVYKGETLPLWLAGKAIPVSDQVLEVATPPTCKSCRLTSTRPMAKLSR